jgi:hypothetical protein
MEKRIRPTHKPQKELEGGVKLVLKDFDPAGITIEPSIASMEL